MPRAFRNWAVALTGAMLVTPCIAQEAPPAVTPVEAIVEAPAPKKLSAFDIAPLSENTLKAQAGREDTAMVAQSNSNATVAQNSVGDNSVTGDISIDDQAFQNLSGLSVLNINSGNNVAINSSMNVNISITPGQ